jgi:hypothetical protein
MVDLIYTGKDRLRMNRDILKGVKGKGVRYF